MEFMDVVRQRQAVRDYAEEALDPAMIQSLIEAATQAPSARNLQPWSFWVVQGRDQVDELAEKAQEWLMREFHEDTCFLGVLQRGLGHPVPRSSPRTTPVYLNTRRSADVCRNEIAHQRES